MQLMHPEPAAALLGLRAMKTIARQRERSARRSAD